MQIFIKTLTGNTITLDCDSIDNLKQQISEREGLDIDRQRLNYGGKELDAESLSDGITVHLSSRMMGGKDDPLPKYIALIVLSVIIGIFFVIWPIFYLTWKSMSNYTSIVTETSAAETIQSRMRKNAMNLPILIVIATVLGVGMYYVLKDLSPIEIGIFTLSILLILVPLIPKYFNKNFYNTTIHISIGIATVLGVGMYYVLKDLSPTEIGIFTPLILLLLFPLIMKYVYKFENWPAEPTNILFILVLIIFSIVQTFKTGDEFSRAIVLNSSIILILSYIAQRYYIDSTRQYYQNVSALDALKNSLLLTGASAVFLVSIL